MFFDWVTFSNAKWPHGYYLGFKHSVRGYSKKWKIDIWFIENEGEGSQKYSKLLRDASDKQRKLILEIKKNRQETCGDYSSTYIYDAVLQEGIKDTKQFNQYLGEIL